MESVTREFMRGRFECLAANAKAAQEIFESYLAETDNPAEKEMLLERLYNVLKGTERAYNELLDGLKAALKEDK